MTDAPLPEMPCREFVEVVTAYLEDSLPAVDRARFDAHLAECEACAEYLEQMRLTIATLGRIEPEALSPDALASLMAAFRSA